MLTVGALFAGYGGMEQGIAQVLPVSLSWFAEFDAAPSAVMAHHHPGVPNLGDVTKVDWSAVPRVDVITGGSPCQDLSHAGKRKGMTDGTRSNLWAEMREAVAVLRPRLVVWENVRGAYSAHADSDLEPCAGCVGGDGSDGEPVLRALGRVLGDLSELGYDANWYGLRAADVGAPHGRFRVFLFAQPADADVKEGLRGAAGTSQTGRHGHAESRPGRPDLTLLPTPVVNDMGEGKTVEHWDAWTDRMKAAVGNGNGHGKSLAIEAQRLLPTPTSSDTNGAGAHGTGGPDLRTAVSLPPTPTAADSKASGGSSPSDVTLTDAVVRTDMGRQDNPRHLLGTPTVTMSRRSAEFASVGETPAEFAANYDGTWGDYAPAIARWEAVLGRPAPAPTEPNAKGGHRLSPRFVEFLMGVPEGWVCDVPGITRNQALKALGNGIVPQQCAAALRAFLWDAYGIGAAA